LTSLSGGTSGAPLRLSWGLVALLSSLFVALSGVVLSDVIIAANVGEIHSSAIGPTDEATQLLGILVLVKLYSLVMEFGGGLIFGISFVAILIDRRARNLKETTRSLIPS